MRRFPNKLLLLLAFALPQPLQALAQVPSDGKALVVDLCGS